MEPPANLTPKGLIDEKVKVFDSMLPVKPEDVVKGQFDGYQDIEGVASDSDTETFVAARLRIDNPRWAGVPFYLRIGKCLAESRQTVSLAFRSPLREIFEGSAGAGLRRNHLTIELGGSESVAFRFLAKAPGPTIELGDPSPAG